MIVYIYFQYLLPLFYTFSHSLFTIFSPLFLLPIGLQFLYDVRTTLTIVNCDFVWKNGNYDALLASGTVNREDLLYLSLADGRVELISGIGRPSKRCVYHTPNRNRKYPLSHKSGRERASQRERERASQSELERESELERKIPYFRFRHSTAFNESLYIIIYV